MGLFGAAFGLGFIVGPALGAALAYVGRHISGEVHGTAWPAFGAAVISLVAFLLVWRFLPEPPKAAPAPDRPYPVLSATLLRAAVSHPRLRELFALMFGAVFAFVLLEVTFVYLCTHSLGVTETGTGMIFAYIGALMVIVQGGLVGPLVRRFGEATLVATGPFITAVGFLLISVVPLTGHVNIAWLLLIVGCLPVSMGQGLTTPNMAALISHHAAKQRQGMTLGLSQGVASLARAIAPPVGGLLYDVGPSWPYWIGTLLFIGVGFFAASARPALQAAMRRQGEDQPREPVSRAATS
jgi:MFS family permease